MSDINNGIITEIRKEATELEKSGLTGDKCLVLILLKLLESSCLAEEEDTKLTTFFDYKKREKSNRHLGNILLYCYTDD